MPVETRHPQYRERHEQWQRCRDTYEGGDAVKARGAAYLPQPDGQDYTEYLAYKDRAMFYNCVGRTVHGLSGTVMRKPPTQTLPKVMEEWTKDVTRTSESLGAFVQKQLDELIKIGRVGVLLELPEQPAAAVRPYWITYHAEQITNWDYRWDRGERKLISVVLFEVVTREKDRFETEEVEQYRHLWLDPLGAYTVSKYQKRSEAPAEAASGKKDEWVQVGEDVQPVIRGETLNYIPFQCIAPFSLTLECEKPVLLDLVDVQLSHYRSSADLENGRHWCGTPQPWVAGVSGTSVLKIGGRNAWKFQDASAKAGMLEFTGQGLTPLEKAMSDKEGMMAVLGARLLEQQPQRVQETAEAVRTRHQGEHSVLANIASTFSEGILQLLTWTADWMSLPTDTMVFELNRDFFELKLSPQELTAVVAAWQSGAMSFATLQYNLRRGELTRPDITDEQEKKEIDAEADTDPDEDAVPGGRMPPDDDADDDEE